MWCSAMRRLRRAATGPTSPRSCRIFGRRPHRRTSSSTTIWRATCSSTTPGHRPSSISRPGGGPPATRRPWSSPTRSSGTTRALRRPIGLPHWSTTSTCSSPGRSCSGSSSTRSSAPTTLVAGIWGPSSGPPAGSAAACEKRRGRDSNPRTRKPPLRDFQSRSLSQLGHLSGRREYAIRLPHAAGSGIVGWRGHVLPGDEARYERMADDRLETLRKVSLFEGLTDRELEAVAHAAKERRFDTGDTVVVEGEGGVGFFVVAEGTARVEARGQRLGTIAPGGPFGGVGPLDGAGRRASAAQAGGPRLGY